MSARPRLDQRENNLINRQKPLFEVIDCNFALDLKKSNFVEKITVMQSIKMFDLLLRLNICSRSGIYFANQDDLLLCSAFVKAHNLYLYKLFKFL